MEARRAWLVAAILILATPAYGADRKAFIVPVQADCTGAENIMHGATLPANIHVRQVQIIAKSPVTVTLYGGPSNLVKQRDPSTIYMYYVDAKDARTDYGDGWITLTTGNAFLIGIMCPQGPKVPVTIIQWYELTP